MNCEVTWAEWGACANGFRKRSQEVKMEKVGAGEDCPSLTSQTEGLLHHVLLSHSKMVSHTMFLVFWFMFSVVK